MKKIYGLSIGYLKYYATNKGNIVKTHRAKERYCKKPTVFLSYSIYIRRTSFTCIFKVF